LLSKIKIQLKSLAFITIVARLHIDAKTQQRAGNRYVKEARDIHV